MKENVLEETKKHEKEYAAEEQRKKKRNWMALDCLKGSGQHLHQLGELQVPSPWGARPLLSC